MLSNKEISQNFEVQISTLYNWRKTKPKLYKYLQNADYNFEQNKEINILLKRFAKDIKSSMSVDQIRVFIESKFEAKSIDEIENMHRGLLSTHYRDLNTQKANLYFELYENIAKLNIVEKYIFYKRVYNIRNNKTVISDEDIKEYFEEFLGD
jgi:integrase